MPCGWKATVSRVSGRPGHSLLPKPKGVRWAWTQRTPCTWPVVWGTASHSERLALGHIWQRPETFFIVTAGVEGAPLEAGWVSSEGCSYTRNAQAPRLPGKDLLGSKCQRCWGREVLAWMHGSGEEGKCHSEPDDRNKVLCLLPVLSRVVASLKRP